MSDTKETSANKLSLNKGTLGLKSGGVKTGAAASRPRQGFANNRDRNVKVEVRRKRVYQKPNSKAPSPESDGLSEAERQRRIKALQGAAELEAQRQNDVKESERRAEEMRRARVEREQAEQVQIDAVAETEKRRLEKIAADKRAREEAARLVLEQEEKARTAASRTPPRTRRGKPTKSRDLETEALAVEDVAVDLTPTAKSDTKPSLMDPDNLGLAGGRIKTKKTQNLEIAPSNINRKDSETRRRSGKLTLHQALDADENPRVRSMASLRRAKEKERKKNILTTRKEKVVREVTIPEIITVAALANRMAERSADVVKALMKMGVMATQNQTIDADTAELICEEMGHKVKRVAESDIEDILIMQPDAPEDMEARPPVVTIMGHVDHGKTSLLDAFRSTDIAADEAGGITQHIGAYQVTMSTGDRITFLDTPGHEAFTAMRMRGASVTDIVVLVVAADDGIQPQTIEAINHAKAADVPIIVAVNKTDKADADAMRIRTQLLEHDLVVEEMGGEVIAVDVSAKNRVNIDALEEAILVQAEILELKASAKNAARGSVVEARLERGRGSVATILVQSGTLRVGDIFVAGQATGRVRALLDDHGKHLVKAVPSQPVEILGLQGTPEAGDNFAVVDHDQAAREIAEYRSRKARAQKQVVAARGTLEQMFNQIKAGEIKELALIIKTDVQGSLEAITASLLKLANDEVKVRLLHGAVGGITESDVTLAASVGGVIIGFNTRANPQARDLAQQDGVDIRYYDVIYDVIDDAKKILGGLLAPEQREKFLGYADIREVFAISRTGKIAGCYVTEGKVKRGASVRLLRDDVVIYNGALKQLRRFKDDVRDVAAGYECGMALENYDDIKVGDRIECFEIEEIARIL